LAGSRFPPFICWARLCSPSSNHVAIFDDERVGTVTVRNPPLGDLSRTSFLEAVRGARGVQQLSSGQRKQWLGVVDGIDEVEVDVVVLVPVVEVPEVGVSSRPEVVGVVWGAVGVVVTEASLDDVDSWPVCSVPVPEPAPVPSGEAGVSDGGVASAPASPEVRGGMPMMLTRSGADGPGAPEVNRTTASAIWAVRARSSLRGSAARPPRPRCSSRGDLSHQETPRASSYRR
jgi:hypothetical protein